MVCFQMTSQEYALTVLSQEYINYLIFCHNLLHRELGHFSFPQIIMVVHCIAAIMLIGPGE